MGVSRRKSVRREGAIPVEEPETSTSSESTVIASNSMVKAKPRPPRVNSLVSVLSNKNAT